MENLNYINTNINLWNVRTGYHIKSEFYKLDKFVKGWNSLNEIELALLGDIRDKKILHLQCHFGMDTISLSRLGATVTGIDFSENAINKANELAEQLKVTTRFICLNIYDLPVFLNEKFDIVFTSYGTIGWLPDLDKWANVIATFLKPGSTFIFVEFHPVVWMFDNNFNTIEYSYFKKEPIIEVEENTYADRNASIKAESITWNHSISEVFQSLVNAGLLVTGLQEYNYSPYNCFNDCEQTGDKKFMIKKFGDKILMVYSIIAKMKNQ